MSTTSPPRKSAGSSTPAKALSSSQGLAKRQPAHKNPVGSEGQSPVSQKQQDWHCWLNNHLPSQQCGRQYLKYDCRVTIKIVDPCSLARPCINSTTSRPDFLSKAAVGSSALDSLKARRLLFLSTGKILR